MFTYKLIDSWTSKINETECEFRIIQYDGKDTFVIERVLPDDTNISHNVPSQMTQREVENYFKNNSAMSIPS